MKVRIDYKGPSVHRRTISRRDLESADVDFKDGEKFETLVFDSGSGRRAVRLESGDNLSEETIEQIVEVLKKDTTFSIKADEEQVAKAAENAAEVNPDGSSKATGAGGSPALAQATGGTAGKTR